MITAHLTQHFKKVDFKPWQLSVIKAVLGAKNSLVVQPTGSGKVCATSFYVLPLEN